MRWGVTVHARQEREWVSYDPKGNKVECSLKQSGDTSIFVWHWHKEIGDAYVWHSQKDIGDTHYICLTLTQRKVGQLHSEKEAKKCGSPHNHNGNIWKKKEQRRFVVSERNKRALCDSHTKLRGTVLMENWRIWLAVHT